MSLPAHERFVGVSLNQRRAWQAICRACGATDAISDRSSRELPTELVSRKLTQRGWVIGRKAQLDLCPACVAASRVKVKPARDAARTSEPPPACLMEPAAMATNVTPLPVAADPPRQPSRDDRRAIHDAIDQRWNDKRGCYLKDHTDKVVAEALNVPRAWVTQVREGFFGEADVNEARIDGLAQLEGVIARASSLEERAMALAADAEQLRRDAEAIRRAAAG